MSLSAGDQLGHYKIRSLIGKGGMGEVYQALDTKLDRDVAIKVLPSSFANDRERLARFEREAKVLASLNHPGIASIYGVEDHALVMELVPGPTLADRIAQEPIPVNEAEQILLQLADALEYAHDKGVIHRDLKPANIKIDAEDKVKILDFGLAKAFSDPLGSFSDDPSNSPTLTMGATIAGTILGTAAYMAPEQARGKKVDKRADIWAFGVVAWEVLTGERLFKGETTVEVLGKVLEQKPDIDRVPQKFRKLLARCLDRNVRDRLRDIGEVRFLLAESPAQPVDVSLVPPPARSPRLAWAATALFALIAGAAGFGYYRASQPAAPKPLVRLDVDFGPDISFPSVSRGPNVVISPDGTRLAYIAKASGSDENTIFMRRLDQPKATELAGTKRVEQASFSPDGQWVVFTASGALNKISVEGGAVVRLASGSRFLGVTWLDDGSLIIGGQLGGLTRVPAAGGEPVPFLDVVAPESGLVRPKVLPGGRALLFESFVGNFSQGNSNIEVATVKANGARASGRKLVIRGGTSPRYVQAPNGAGYLLYTSQATLFAIQFDAARLETSGSAVPILDDILHNRQSGRAQYDVSSTGTLVYRQGGATGTGGLSTLQWVDATGKREPLLAKPGLYANPRVSPDGKQVALNFTEGSNRDVWFYDAQRDATTKLTFGGGDFEDPVWSPDGRFIFFGSATGLQWTRSDGAGKPSPLLVSKVPQRPWAVSPDGHWLGYMQVGPTGKQQIWIVPLEFKAEQWQAGKPQRLLNTDTEEINPIFSPDGRWVAYHSAEAGSMEVFVRPFPLSASGQGGKWQISKGNNSPPVWSRNGRELFYPVGANVMVVSYTAKGDVFLADPPKLWLANAPVGNFDLSADGKRILVAVPVEEAEKPTAEHKVAYLENFFDELQRKMPTNGK